MTNVAVVIPFYQRSVGILSRALRSIERQKNVSDLSIRVIVVDDASPVSMAQELAATGMSLGISWELLTQPNGGPGAARNAALQHLKINPPDFVAFLDSDDEWLPDHLERALSVLGDTVDFYGADHRRLGEVSTFFETRLEARSVLDRFGKQRTAADMPVFDLSGSSAIRAFVCNYLAQTSTVVYRWSVLGDVRFDTSLRTAGEDHLFWLECSSIARMCSIDLKLGVQCFEGVNIYETAVSWDDSATLKRAFYLFLLWSTAQARFGHDPEVAAEIGARLKNHRRFFVYLWMRGLMRRRETNVALLGQLTRRDPLALPRLAGALFGVGLTRLSSGAFHFVEH